MFESLYIISACFWLCRGEVGLSFLRVWWCDQWPEALSRLAKSGSQVGLGCLHIFPIILPWAHLRDLGVRIWGRLERTSKQQKFRAWHHIAYLALCIDVSLHCESIYVSQFFTGEFPPQEISWKLGCSWSQRRIKIVSCLDLCLFVNALMTSFSFHWLRKAALAAWYAANRRDFGNQAADWVEDASCGKANAGEAEIFACTR